MQFSIAAAVLAVATAAFAQERNPDPKTGFSALTHPERDEEVVAGTTYKIEWTVPEEYAEIQVNLILIGGDTERDEQVPYLNITRGIDNSLGEYEWDIPSNLGGLRWNGIIIEDVADTINNYQYSMPFRLLRDPNAPSSSESISESITSTPSSSASSSASSSETESSSVPASTTDDASSSSIETTSPTTTPDESSNPVESNPAESSPSGDSGATQAKAGILALFGGLVVAFML